MRKGDRFQATPFHLFRTSVCCLFLNSAANGWRKHLVLTPPNTPWWWLTSRRPMLMKGIWQMQVMEEEEESVANTEAQIPVSKAHETVCFISTGPSLFVSMLCVKTTCNSKKNSTHFLSLTRLINTFTHSLSFVSVVVITHSDQKQLEGGKGLFVSFFQVTVHPWKDVSIGAPARTWCSN